MKFHDYVFKNEEEEYDENMPGSTKYIDTFFELSYYKYINEKPNIFNTIKIKQVACGDGFTFVLDQDGVLYSFGKNNDGQLGFSQDFHLNTLVNGIKTVLSPKKSEFFFDKGIKVKDVICGSNFTFVLDSKDIIYSFGNNSCGQLARLIDKSSNNPKPEIANLLIESGKPIKICCGWFHGMLLNDFGEVYIWGNPYKDYKKVLNIEDIDIPKKVSIGNEEYSNINFVDICCGFNHFAAIGINQENQEKIKELFTWGTNEFVLIIKIINQLGTIRTIK
jgi:alpha-tubulin suppressor-like RCC1 family protein